MAPRGPARLGRRAYAMLALYLLTVVSCWGTDDSTGPRPSGVRVLVSNAAGGERGVLAVSYASSVGYQGFVSKSDTISIGERQTPGDVVVFSRLRPPTLQVMEQWNAENIVRLGDQLKLPITIWVVKGPFEEVRRSVLNAIATTDAIWDAERVGATLTPVTITDATTNPRVGEFFQFGCESMPRMRSAIGETPGQINIYIVELVRLDNGIYGPGNGYWCGGGSVAMGWLAASDLMAHEIGHAFGLSHIDDLTSLFDRTNVMHPSSVVRQFLTEGQVFRATFGNASDINRLYQARLGQPTRDCARDASTVTCPRIQLRLWADGSFPANY